MINWVRCLTCIHVWIKNSSRMECLVRKTTWSWKRVDDNSIVNVCSNYSTPLPLHKSKRRVPQPHLISTYNKGMGVADLLDFLSASYRPSIRGKSGISQYLPMYWMSRSYQYREHIVMLHIITCHIWNSCVMWL